MKLTKSEINIYFNPSKGAAQTTYRLAFPFSLSDESHTFSFSFWLLLGSTRSCMGSCIVKQVHELLVQGFRRLLRLLLPVSTQGLHEALAFREALELVNALVRLANAIFSCQVNFSWIDRRNLEINHSLTEVPEQVESGREPSHQMRLIL